VDWAATLAAWHDAFILFGTAAATLIGLMFVAASVSAGNFSWDKRHALRLFLSSSVVQFAAVLAMSVAGLAPVPSPKVLAALAAAVALFGLGYAAIVAIDVIRAGFTSRLDAEDGFWYAVLPPLGHVTLLAASVVLLRDPPAGCAVLAAGMAVLLFAGIRNAWDITIWIVTHRGN
jgi:hypothetical protein